MKNKGCLNAEQPDWYRMHYCGTCKSLGTTYGQKSRLMLNYDAVFLAEILSLISSKKVEWSGGLSSHNCFDLPERDDIPLSVRYASDVNMLLAQLKFEDNLLDDVPQLWKLANRVFRKPFDKLEDHLGDWAVDINRIEEWLKEGFKREDEVAVSTQESVEKSLAFYGESTANITSYLFGHGAGAVGSEEQKDNLAKLGYLFGELIFALDAWKDIGDDEEMEQFNPLFIGKDEDFIINQEIAKEYIWQKAEAINQTIETFPIDKEILDVLKSRLLMNISSSLNETANSCNSFSTGIEKSTLPRIANKANAVLKHISDWTNPAIPAKFVASYTIFIFLFFHQQVSSAAVRLNSTQIDPGTNIMDSLFLLGLGMLPLLGYWLATHSKEQPRKTERLKKRLERKQKRLKKRLLKMAKRQKEGKKLKWWAWMLIGIAGLFFILTIAFLISFLSCAGGGGCNCGGGGSSGGGCCDGSSCCGGGCDCGNCNCDCNC